MKVIKNIKDSWSEFRLTLSIFLIKLAVKIINKNTLEGISLVVSVDSWARYLEHSFKESVDSKENILKNKSFINQKVS